MTINHRMQKHRRRWGPNRASLQSENRTTAPPPHMAVPPTIAASITSPAHATCSRQKKVSPACTRLGDPFVKSGLLICNQRFQPFYVAQVSFQSSKGSCRHSLVRSKGSNVVEGECEIPIKPAFLRDSSIAQISLPSHYHTDQCAANIVCACEVKTMKRVYVQKARSVPLRVWIAGDFRIGHPTRLLLLKHGV